jgi:ribosomal-protein-alanine N-acetyltransferase
VTRHSTGTWQATAIGLRRWTLADADWYAEEAREAEIQKWTTERPDVCAEQVRRAIDGCGSDPTAWVIVDPATGERLGNASVELLGEAASACYWVAKHARGRGVATEALRLMIEECRARGALRMELEIHQDNMASKRVAEKLGFSPAGESNHPMLGRCDRYSMRLHPRRETRA